MRVARQAAVTLPGGEADAGDFSAGGLAGEGPESLRQQVGLVAYPLAFENLRHLHPERGRWMTLWAAEPERVTFRLMAPRAWPVRAAWQAAEPTSVIFRLGAWLASLVWVLLKVAVFLRLAATPARTARVLRQAAVTLRAAAVSRRDRDVQRGPRRGAS